MRWTLLILLILLLTPIDALAEHRFSVQLTGAYTEFDGLVPLAGSFDPPPFDFPFLPEPIDPDPVPISGEVPFSSEGRTWEVLLSYRFASHFQIQGGYLDLGSFSSEAFGGPIVGTAIIGTPGAFSPIQPLPPPLTRPGLGAFDPGTPISGGIITTPANFSQSRYHLDAQAITLGAKADYPIAGKLRVYGRLGLLRARFDAADTFGEFINLSDPDDENGWYWGAGLQYPVLDRLLLGGGFAQYDVKIQRFDSWQLNLEVLLF